MRPGGFQCRRPAQRGFELARSDLTMWFRRLEGLREPWLCPNPRRWERKQPTTASRPHPRSESDDSKFRDRRGAPVNSESRLKKHAVGLGNVAEQDGVASGNCECGECGSVTTRIERRWGIGVGEDRLERRSIFFIFYFLISDCL